MILTYIFYVSGPSMDHTYTPEYDASRLFLSVLLVDKVFKGDHELSSQPPESLAEFVHSRNSLKRLQKVDETQYKTRLNH